MVIPEARLDFKPTDKLGQMLRYVYFGANEEDTYEDFDGVKRGDEMGHNIQWLTTYDEAWFIRFQLMYKF